MPSLNNMGPGLCLFHLSLPGCNFCHGGGHAISSADEGIELQALEVCFKFKIKLYISNLF